MKTVLNECSCSLPNETGGVLLGYRRDDTGDIVIVEASPPGPNTIKTSSSFSPDSDFDAAVVHRAFTCSEGLVTYLGDWHSHVYAKPYLSRRDLRVLRRIGRYPRAETPEPIMLIVGGFPRPRCSAWLWLGRNRQFRRASDRIRQLQVRLSDLEA